MISKFKILIIFFISVSFHQTFAQYYDPEKAKEIANPKNQTEQPNPDWQPSSTVQSNLSSRPKPLMEENNIWDKLYFGGNIGLQFGTRATVLQFSPLVGYIISKRFSAGGIIHYMYLKGRNTQGFSVYGLAPFARFMITNDFFAIGEVALLNLPPRNQTFFGERTWVTLPMLGVGYFFRLGTKSGFIISLMYNFNYLNPNSILGPFVYRTGFVF